MVNSAPSDNKRNRLCPSYKWIALGNTTLGTLIASLDANIIFIALPTIASELGTSLFTMVWIIIGYSVVTASILLNFGRLADIFGRVKLYTLGFIIFTFGSGLCSISQSGEELVVFRIVQAVGAAFLFSNSVAILTDSFPSNERGKALGINQIAIVLGSILGLVLGGFLTSYLGWRSIFWINIPIGIIGVVLSYKYLKELGSIRKEKIDWLGNISFAGGLFFILAGMTLSSFGIISNIFIIFLLIFGGIALIIIFAFIEKFISKQYPMFHFSLFKIKSFLGGNIAILLNSIARGNFIFLISIYLQGAFMNLSPVETGIYLIPVSAALAIFGPLSGWLSDRYGSRFFSALGLFITGIGFLSLTQLQIKTNFVELLLPFILLGAGMGIFTSPNRASIMNSVPPSRRGVSGSTGTTLFYVGRSLSVGISFLIMTSILPSEYVKDIIIDFRNTDTTIATGPVNTSNEPLNSEIYNHNETIANKFLSSFHIIFFVSSILVFIAIIPAIIKEKPTIK
ncbi:MAG TPA: MFS transporter [Nitrososphaeraceae archaeon]|nr:MFS transporter [Nitrososphaeraceae archaeon]